MGASGREKYPPKLNKQTNKKKHDAFRWNRKRVRQRGFTFNFSIAHCGGDGRKRKKKGMKGRREPNSCLKIENSSDNTQAHCINRPISYSIRCYVRKQADE